MKSFLISGATFESGVACSGTGTSGLVVIRLVVILQSGATYGSGVTCSGTIGLVVIGLVVNLHSGATFGSGFTCFETIGKVVIRLIVILHDLAIPPFIIHLLLMVTRNGGGGQDNIDSNINNLEKSCRKEAYLTETRLPVEFYNQKCILTVYINLLKVFIDGKGIQIEAVKTASPIVYPGVEGLRAITTTCE